MFRPAIGTQTLAIAAAVWLSATAARAASLPRDRGPLAECSEMTAKPNGPIGDSMTGKVLAVPQIKGIYDPRRCDISSMAIAVRDNGALRDIYYPALNGQRKSPDNRSSPGELTPQQQDGLRKQVIENLVRRVQASAAARIKACGDVKGQALNACLRANPVKILIYTHGGRVTQEGAVFSAEALAPMMIRDGYVPLFLIWNSDDIIAYTDRLCCVTQGSVDPDKGFNKWLSVPTRLFADIGSSLATAPENYFQQAIRFQHSIREQHYDLYALNTWDPAQDCVYFVPIGSHASCNNVIFPNFGPGGSPDQQFKLLNGGDNNKRLKDNLFYAAGFVPRILTTATVSQVGAQEWDNLVRRTRLGFDNESTPVDHPEPGHDERREKECHEDRPSIQRIDEPLTCPTGGFTMFFNELAPYLKNTDDDDATQAWFPISSQGRNHIVYVPVTIEYYGHSMGAIVGDELITRYPGFPWSKIVYMAAADTIRDAKRTFSLVIDSDSNRTKLRIYNLSLHPISESRERVVYGSFPQGSLLEWIDEMFNRPRTGDDRTFGKWKNDEMSLPTWRRDVLERITFRVFPAQNNLGDRNSAKAERAMFDRECDPAAALGEKQSPAICHPVTHGGFTDFSFWRNIYLTGTDAD